MPDPSPITKPSLSASKGLLAVSGLSFLKDSAFALAKPATPSGVMLASAPPQIITSALPSCNNLNESPIALEPAAQAVETDELGPLAPNAIAAKPDAIFGIIMGTVK